LVAEGKENAIIFTLILPISYKVLCCNQLDEEKRNGGENLQGGGEENI
jgi:hypothetical protein